METIQIDKTQWENWLKLKGLAPRTISEYNRCFDWFDTSKISQQYVFDFLTVHRYSIATAFVKNLISFLKTRDISQEFRMMLSLIEIPRITGRKSIKIKNVLTENQVLSLADKTEYLNERYAILICFYGALRLSEITKIKPLDFLWSKWLKNRQGLGILKVTGKGDKQRIVFIPPEVMTLLYDWIQKIANKSLTAEEPLFKMNKFRFDEMLEKASRKVLGKRINPHTLRRSGATWLYERGLGIVELKEFLGHAEISTTALYTMISKQKLGEALEKIYDIEKQEEPKKEEPKNLLDNLQDISKT